MISLTDVDIRHVLNLKPSARAQNNELRILLEKTPPPPAPAPHRMVQGEKTSDVEAAIKDIRLTLQRTKTLPLQHHPEEECEENASSPVWVPR